jgi:hypothetical protein
MESDFSICYSKSLISQRECLLIVMMSKLQAPWQDNVLRSSFLFFLLSHYRRLVNSSCSPSQRRAYSLFIDRKRVINSLSAFSVSIGEYHRLDNI